MTDPGSVNTAEFVDRYVAVWNEPSARTRHELVVALWSDEGVEFSEENEYRGHAAIEKRVAEAYSQFVEGGHFAFRPGVEPVIHHETMTFTIEMVSEATSEPDWYATIFIAMNESGLIERDYQFGRNLK